MITFQTIIKFDLMIGIDSYKCGNTVEYQLMTKAGHGKKKGRKIWNIWWEKISLSLIGILKLQSVSEVW